MRLNLLLDLDGTLLVNEINTFVSAYMRVLGKHMAAYADPSKLVSSLLASTVVMTSNTQPDRTLKDTFDQVFYPDLGINEIEVRETIAQFYRDIFPSLRELTEFRPEAMELIREAKKRDYRVGIATNPIFPRTAIEQRIAWAGINLQEHNIALVPAYETFHFAKPNPAYYAEFMAKLGWPEGPTVMVGNDPAADLAPARKFGIKTFYVPEPGMALPGSDPMLTPGGNLEDVLPWIDSCSQEELLPDFSSPEALLSILRATPAALHSLANDLPDEAWTMCPFPGEWCLAEITCHLRDVDAEVNIPRFQKMLGEENPFLPGMDTDSWVSERQYKTQDCGEALTVFVKNRIQLISMLENLEPNDWQRTARHAIFGPTALREIVNIIVGHDRLHLQQIYKTISMR